MQKTRRMLATLGSGLLIAGAMIACEDATTPGDPVEEAILPGLFPALDGISHDGDLVIVARKGTASALRGGPTFSLGFGYVGEVHRPGFVESWAMVAADGDDPGCEGSGIGFARCVKRHLDNGEECTLHKEGDTYHAHREVPEDPIG